MFSDTLHIGEVPARSRGSLLLQETDKAADIPSVRYRTRPGRTRLAGDEHKWRSETNLVVPSVRPMTRYLAQYGLFTQKRDVQVQTDTSPHLSQTATCGVQTDSRPTVRDMGVQTMSPSESYAAQFVEHLLESVSTAQSPDGNRIKSPQNANTEPPDLLRHQPPPMHQKPSQVPEVMSAMPNPQEKLWTPRLETTLSSSIQDGKCPSSGTSGKEFKKQGRLQSPLLYELNSKDHDDASQKCISTAVLILKDTSETQSMPKPEVDAMERGKRSMLKRSDAVSEQPIFQSVVVRHEENAKIVGVTYLPENVSEIKDNRESYRKINATQTEAIPDLKNSSQRVAVGQDKSYDFWSDSFQPNSWKDLATLEEEIIQSLQNDEFLADKDLISDTKGSSQSNAQWDKEKGSSNSENLETSPTNEPTNRRSHSTRYGLSPVREEQETVNVVEISSYLQPSSYVQYPKSGGSSVQNVECKGLDITLPRVSPVTNLSSEADKVGVREEDSPTPRSPSKSTVSGKNDVESGDMFVHKLSINGQQCGPETTSDKPSFPKPGHSSPQLEQLSFPPDDDRPLKVLQPETSSPHQSDKHTSIVRQSPPQSLSPSRATSFISHGENGHSGPAGSPQRLSPRRDSPRRYRTSTSPIGRSASCSPVLQNVPRCEESESDSCLNAAEILERIQREVGRMTEEVHSTDFCEMVANGIAASKERRSSKSPQEQRNRQERSPVAKTSLESSPVPHTPSPGVCDPKRRMSDSDESNANVTNPSPSDGDGQKAEKTAMIIRVKRNVSEDEKHGKRTILCVSGQRQTIHDSEDTLRCLIVSPPPPSVPPPPSLPLSIPPPPPPLPLSIPPPPSSSPSLSNLGRSPIQDKRQQWLKTFALEELMQKVKDREDKLLRRKDEAAGQSDCKGSSEMLMVGHPLEDLQNSIVLDGVPPQTNVWTQECNRDPLVEPYHKAQSQQQTSMQVNNLSDRYPINAKRIEDGEALPNEAVLVDQKVSIEGDRIHTDSYYALPVQNETTTTSLKPAQKYEGIGPTTVEGIPVGLRTGIKEEHASDWYKTMFKSLHKAARDEDRFHSGGYVSEPDLYQRGISPVPATSNLDPRKPAQNGPEKNNLLKVNDEFTKIRSSSNEELAKSKYNVPLRPISEYEPGYSSIVEREALMRTKHIKPSDKPFYLGTDGYDSDSTIIKKSGQTNQVDPEKQKLLYREIQRGGDIPLSGLRMPAPKKPTVVMVGPAPPPVHEISRHKDQAGIRRPENPCFDDIRSNLNDHLYNDQMPYTSNEKNQKEYHLPERIPKPTTLEYTKIATNGQGKNKVPDQETLARVLYDFRSQNGRELMLNKGDLIKITHQMDKNWYEGYKEGKLGIFPVSYVEIIPPEHDLPTPPSELLECKARAKYDFQTQTSVELSLKKGDIVSLLRQVDQNWFEGMIGDKKGIFPVTYVEILDSINNNQVSSSDSSSPAVTRPSSVIRNCHDKSPCGQEPPLTKEVLKPTCKERQQPSQTMPCQEDSLQSILYKALYVYTPQNRDELELQEGDTVEVVKMCDDGWFVGTSQRTGLFGTFPGNYVEKV